MKMLKEFKEFAMRGNVIDMAVGIILSGVHYESLAEAKAAGAAAVNYGLFINTVIDFVIVAFVIFMVISAINRMKRQPAPAPAAPTTKECPYCFSVIPIKATRCPNCTSELKA